MISSLSLSCWLIELGWLVLAWRSLLQLQWDISWGFGHPNVQLGMTSKEASLMTDSWAWLLAGSSAGAVHQSIFIWPLHVAWASHNVAVGSEKECTKSKCSKRQEVEATRPVINYTWKWNSTISSVSVGPRTCPDLLLLGQEYIAEEHVGWKILLELLLGNTFCHTFLVSL